MTQEELKKTIADLKFNISIYKEVGGDTLELENRLRQLEERLRTL